MNEVQQLLEQSMAPQKGTTVTLAAGEHAHITGLCDQMPAKFTPKAWMTAVVRASVPGLEKMVSAFLDGRATRVEPAPQPVEPDVRRTTPQDGGA